MKKSVEIIINIVLWFFIISLLYTYGRLKVGDFSVLDFLRFVIPILVACFIDFYLFYFIVPHFLKRKRFIFLTVVLFFSSVFFVLLINFFFRFQHLAIGYSLEFSFKYFPFSFILFFITFPIAILGGSLKGAILWNNSIAEKKALEKKHLESKTALLLLKAQLNPHFLFNSLNNIDILIEENPKTASEYLKKLSEVLRYVLYETKEDETELAKEITQIKSYIELQRIRTDNSRYVNFNITGKLKEQKIAPMIFLPFIENAFKHSKNKTIDNAIDIEFELHENKVKMVCKNYYEANQLEVIKNEGLGIETIKQRLNLLYPENHELIINKTEHWFNVAISIKLKDGN
jgi:two-component system, LytTR family, sensor kinase